MASSGGIRAGKAFVELYGDDSQLSRTLDGVGKKFSSWGAGLASIGRTTAVAAAGMITPLVGAVAAWQEMGSQIDDISQRTGASAESLSTLGYAAKLSGTDMETLEKSMRKMQQNLAGAIRGNDEAKTGFERLGLTFAELKDQSPDQQLRLIGSRLDRIKDPALKTATAMDIFGKSGAALIPMFEGGAEGLAQLEQEARNLGLELKGDDVKAAAAFGDQLDTLWSVMKRGVFAVGSALGPALNELVDLVSGYASQAAKWIDANRGIVVTGAKVLAIVLGVGVAIMAAGGALSLLGTALSMGTPLMAALATAVSVVGTVLGALMSPIGLVIAGVGLATAAFLYFTGYAAELVTWLQERFMAMGEFFGKAWGGIVAAVSKGDLGKAAEIAWLTVQLAFFEATAEIWTSWSKFAKGFMDIWDTVTSNLARLFADPWNTIQNWWVTGTQAMLDAWDVVMAGIMNSFASVKGFLSKGIAGLLNLLSGESLTLGFDEIDKNTSKEQSQNNQMRDDSVAARAAETNKQLMALDEQRNDAAKLLDEDLAAKRVSREEDLQSSVKGSADRLNKLRGEWDQSIADGAKAAEEKTPGGSKGPKLPDLDSLQSAEKISLASTFNAGAVRGFGGGALTAAERTAKATEDTARAAKETAENTGRTPGGSSSTGRIGGVGGDTFASSGE